MGRAVESHRDGAEINGKHCRRRCRAVTGKRAMTAVAVEFAAADAAVNTSARAELTGISRWPAVPAAAGFIAGISLHPYAPHHPVIWLLAITVFSAGGFAIRRRAGAATVLLSLALVVAGVAA